MRNRKTSAILAVILLLLAVPGAARSTPGHTQRSAFSDPSRITNPWLPVSTTRTCRLSGTDEGTPLKVKRTLLNRTRTFHWRGQRIEAAVVKDRVDSRGRRVELTHDYFAQNDAGKVFYFGEKVNEYRPGKPIGHEGEWLLGRDTRHPGVLMPAHPRVGDSFRSERVPGVTHEVDHVVAAKRSAKVGGHRYGHVITVRENAGPPPETEFKKYSRGTGVIAEANGGLTLRGCS